MRRLAAGLASLVLSAGLALGQPLQNYVAPTPPVGDSSDRIATTAFVFSFAPTSIFISNDATTNAAECPLWAAGVGSQAIKSSCGAFNFNPSTGILSATTYASQGDVILYHPLTPSPNPVIGPRTNIGVGYGALSGITSGTISSNTVYATAVGYQASAALTTADHTTSLGAFALASITDNTGQNNTALGIDSLRSLTSGVQNVAVGEHTMTNVVTGASYNSAFGLGAMFNAGGTYNVGVGYNSLSGAVSPALTGTTNTGVGAFSLASVSGAANYNTGMGAYALFGVTNGGQNVGLGYLSGFNLTTGVNNTIIGAGVAPTLVSGSNNIIIGNYGVQADVPAAGTNSFLSIGNIIYGTGLGGTAKIGIGLTAPTTTLDVSGTFHVSGATTFSSTVGLAGITTVTNANPTIIYNSSPTAGTASTQFYDAGTLKYQVGMQSATDFFIYDAASTAMMIQYTNSANLLKLMPTTGSVAIGTTTKPALNGSLFANGWVQTGGTVVASLPTCNTAAKGARYYVTDASGPTFLGTLTGGGAVNAPVFCNGTAWVAG